MSRTSGERSSPNDIEMEAIILHVWIRWFVRLSRNFYVVVVPLKRKPGTIKNLINPDEMDMEEVQYVGGEAPELCSGHNTSHSQWFGIQIFETHT